MGYEIINGDTTRKPDYNRKYGTIVMGDFSFSIYDMYFWNGFLWVKALCATPCSVHADHYEVYGTDGTLIYKSRSVKDRFIFTVVGQTNITMQIDILHTLPTRPDTFILS